MKLGIVGGGKMAEAIIIGVFSKKLFKPEEIMVGEISQERKEYLTNKFSVTVSVNNEDVVKDSNIILLAIKPQHFEVAAAGLKNKLSPTSTLISIMAGITIQKIQNLLNHNLVVRVMPNTPAQVQMGMSVWTCTEEVTVSQKMVTTQFLQALGKELYVEDESFIDMATALSGSGPAYVLFFLESMIEAGKSIGFSEPQATLLAKQTLLGTAQLVELSNKSPKDLRLEVTSPGGTTAEAIKIFEKKDLLSMTQIAVEAAFNKSKSLGQI